MSSVKNFCMKTTEIAKRTLFKTKDAFTHTGNKIINHLTPKKDYSYLSEEDANAMRKLDRAETIDNICWFSFYLVYYLILIAYCVKKAKDIEGISADE